MTRKKVLISGAGIAGPTLAFWLARLGLKQQFLVTGKRRSPDDK